MDNARVVLVWPWPFRLIHWSLAACVCIAWLTPNTYDTIHRVSGYTVLILIGLRIVLGFIGPPHLRFSRMLLTVCALPDYMWSRRATPKALAQLGLNPAGATMAFIFLLLLLVCAVTGWMQVTERHFGVAWVQDTHTYSSYVLLGLIPLHVIGVLLTSALQRENLIAGMITGRRRL